ncbi:carboxypeptidase-like regulatory domain-containing protein [Maribacter sp. ACAM166]|uniref:carboxypeptidase-like regulatory domain-containing protein n=1 Tax=Maribacter sp. ACAM166 TaxID=2508996 RepID=UPI0010FCEA77|nr:carboxypeptidase-like regulatory domain-containing protein [Maribacter sp. ACAM166]TLP80987.1 carboxypeptidase-like regulatory domain-containing protein [Maribacter sp. ACAM166]
MKPHFCILLLFSIFTYSQNRRSGIVLVEADKSPMEFVGIYNGTEHTMTNADGRFLFSSTSDSITIYRPGYDKRSTSFQKVSDTIYLQKSVLELNEVTVTNEKTLWQKVKDSIKSNYALYPYKEKFLLRGVLRYNGEITRIQDIQGKLKRKTLLYT